MQGRRMGAVTAAFALMVVAAMAGWIALRQVRPAEAEVIDWTAQAPYPVGQVGGGEGRRGLTLIAAGDVLAHPEMWHQARRDGRGEFDFYPMFAHVAPSVSAADLAICHLETVVAPPTGPFEGFPRFSVPPQIVAAIKRTGFDTCSTASNHAIDHGETGVRRTIHALESVGVRHAGTSEAATESLVPTIHDVGGIRVAHLAYSKHFNGIDLPKGREWIANRIDVGAIQQAAAQARQLGADIVVVSMHWGTEYQHEPDADQQAWAKSVIQLPDVDVILGHHAHVVQPVEYVSGKWIIYGMGNQIARHTEPTNDNREGVMMRLRFTEVSPGTWQVTHAEAIPIWVELNPDIRLIDLPRAVADASTPESKRAIFKAAIERIRGHLTTRGGDLAGLTIIGIDRPK